MYNIQDDWQDIKIWAQVYHFYIIEMPIWVSLIFYLSDLGFGASTVSQPWFYWL